MSRLPVSRTRPHSCSACALPHSFCQLPDELRAAFDALKTTVSYAEGEAIFQERDRCESVFAVCEGSAKLIATSTDGRSLLLRFMQPGEMLGLAEAVLGPERYECSALAAENSMVAVIPRETFLRFIRTYPAACLAVTIALSKQYQLAQRETKLLGFGDTSTVRLAHLLLGWPARFRVAGEQHGPASVRVSQGDLAQAIGATRETVTRILGQLSRAGVIERRASTIVVIRPAELARLATSSHVTTIRDGGPPHRFDADLSMS